MGMESQPALVLLPDCTIRMYFVDCNDEHAEDGEEARPLTVGDVLRDYPGHSLGKTSDPHRSTLAPWQQLRAGATYHLARVDKWRPVDAWRPLPPLQLELPSATGCGGGSLASAESIPLTDASPSSEHRGCAPLCAKQPYAPHEPSVLVKDWENCCVSQCAAPPSGPATPALVYPGEPRAFPRAQSMSPSISNRSLFPSPFPSPRTPHPPTLPSPRAGRPPLHRHNSIGSRALERESVRDTSGAPPLKPPSPRITSSKALHPSPRGVPLEHPQGVCGAGREAAHGGATGKYQLSIKTSAGGKGEEGRAVGERHAQGREQAVLGRRHSVSAGAFLRELRMMHEEEGEQQEEACAEGPAARRRHARGGGREGGRDNGDEGPRSAENHHFANQPRSRLSGKLGALVGKGVRVLVRGRSEPEGTGRRGDGSREHARSLKRTVSNFNSNFNPNLKEETNFMDLDALCGDLGKPVRSNRAQAERGWNWAPAGTLAMSGPQLRAAFSRTFTPQR